jgi:hypothetical protein
VDNGDGSVTVTVRDDVSANAAIARFIRVNINGP